MSDHVISLSSLSLRSIAEADRDFLLGLYYSTREQELSHLPWSDEQKQQFIELQFNAQHQHYITHYPHASFAIILSKGDAIGRLCVEEWEREFRLIDIALMPEYCGQGIGSWFLKDLMEKAGAVSKNLSIHVEQNNPALRLYQRLGFEKVGAHNIYDLMVWRAAVKQRQVGMMSEEKEK